VKGRSEEISTASMIMGFVVDVDGEPMCGFLGGKLVARTLWNSLPEIVAVSKIDVNCS
jgi:hypothetical protein